MKVLMLDVSYKEAKHLYQYQCKPVFKGLVTGLNEYVEIRLQFHIYTDSHEQMLAALEAFENTRQTLGFPDYSCYWRQSTERNQVVHEYDGFS